MIEIKHLNKTYDRHRSHANHVLHDVSLTLPDTGFVCILGPSGCGKTSLLNAIGGLDTFDNGSIQTGNFTANRKASARSDAQRNQHFGYIFQNYYLLPEHSVGYNVYLGLHSLKLSHREKLHRVREALQAVDMDRYIRRNVSELSGGQQQRVAIARTLARKPKVILADEPTGNLDEANTRNICTLLRQISKSSLVLMVTHEQRIAKFFADRIITLSEGRIVSDETDWQRQSLSVADSEALYTADYREESNQLSSLQLRLFREEGAAPAQLSVLVLKDQIVIKLDDGRTLSCGSSEELPLVVEGSRPELTVEDVDKAAITWEPAPEVPSRPGRGIRLRQMLAEARHMNRAKGLKAWGTRLFLLLMTVLTAIGIADYLKLQTIDPEDFITTHSQALRISINRGPALENTMLGTQAISKEFKDGLRDWEHPIHFVPVMGSTTSITGSAFLQAGELKMDISHCNYVPLDLWDESTLILGRAPQNPEEVVIDRWLLDALMEEESVATNGITGEDYFLGKQLAFVKQEAQPTIVGVCDSGEPAVYMHKEMMTTLGTGGVSVASLSSLQAKYPGKYDHVELADDECIVLPHNAGAIYRDKLGAQYTNSSFTISYTIVMSIEETDFYPRIIVADSQIDDLLWSTSHQQFWLLCQDKTAAAQYMRQVEQQMDGRIEVTIIDSYVGKMAEYTEASRMRADARTILTVTIVAMSMVMLYLLRRAQVTERIGMLAVYRLLGVPARKLVGIFTLESLIATLTTALPSALAVYLALLLLKDKAELLLPLSAAAWVYAGVTVFHLLVTLLPMLRLLRLPPARLAAKYDF